MAHSNSIIDSYRIELGGKAALLFDIALHFLSDIVEVGVAGDQLYKPIPCEIKARSGEK
jgi:hypothetical protein